VTPATAHTFASLDDVRITRMHRGSISKAEGKSSVKDGDGMANGSIGGEQQNGNGMARRAAAAAWQ